MHECWNAPKQTYIHSSDNSIIVPHTFCLLLCWHCSFLAEFNLETPTPPVSSITLAAKSSVFELMVTKSPILRAKANFASRMSAIITLVAPVIIISIVIVSSTVKCSIPHHTQLDPLIAPRCNIHPQIVYLVIPPPMLPTV